MPTIPEAIIYKKVGEETVLLDYERGVYYGLDAVGAFIWERLAEAKSREELLEALLAEYDVSRQDAERDVDALLADLQSHSLIEL